MLKGGFFCMKTARWDIMDVNCDVIDKTFLPPNAIKKGRTTPISGIAVPQGNPFLGAVKSNEQMLRGAPRIYR
jgi:hypothetical protein